MLKWQLYGLLNIRSWLGWRIYHWYLGNIWKKNKNEAASFPPLSRGCHFFGKNWSLEINGSFFFFFSMKPKQDTSGLFAFNLEKRISLGIDGLDKIQLTIRELLRNKRNTRKDKKDARRHIFVSIASWAKVCLATWWSFSWWTHVTESTERQIQLQCKGFAIGALIGQNLMSKSKWWVLNIACKWTPNVEFDFDLCVHSRQCLTDTSKSNSTLGTFSDVCLWSFLSFLFANSALISAQQLALLGFFAYHLMLRHERWLVCGRDSNPLQS